MALSHRRSLFKKQKGKYYARLGEGTAKHKVIAFRFCVFVLFNGYFLYSVLNDELV